MKIRESTGDRIAKEYRDYVQYELAIRRHVVLLRIGVVFAVLPGFLRLPRAVRLFGVSNEG